VANGSARRGGAPGEAAVARASEGGSRPPSGPTGARGRRGLGRAGRVSTRPKGLFGLKERRRKTGCRTILSNFLNKDLILKAKDLNTFNPNFNWNQTGMN
jgi:hypothetical protein